MAVVAAAVWVVGPTARVLGPTAMPLEFCLGISSHPDLHVDEVHLHGVIWTSSIRHGMHSSKSMGRAQKTSQADARIRPT